MFNQVFKVCSSSSYEHPKNRISNYGVKSLTDNELLSVILGDGEIKDYHGSDINIYSATVSELVENGMTMLQALKTVAVVEYSTRLWKKVYCDGNVVLNDNSSAFNYFGQDMKFLTNEVFRVVALNNSHRVICDKILTVGTDDASLVSITDVARFALTSHAKSIIIAHNHPSGSATPSDEDITVTQRIKNALDLLSINLLDHIIISGNDSYSFRERGLV